MIKHTNPKVFISYAWTNKTYRNKIIKIAELLIQNGIDVVIDAWDLKTGQDKYDFMERCVTDKSIDHILIFCNKDYTDKANQRLGGVGDETAIITPHLYGQSRQQKFIPIVMEKDATGKAYLPEYLQSRIFKDFTEDHFMYEYESLVRELYGELEYQKPKLGNIPSWVNTSTENVIELSSNTASKQYDIQSIINEKFTFPTPEHIGLTIALTDGKYGGRAFRKYNDTDRNNFIKLGFDLLTSGINQAMRYYNNENNDKFTIKIYQISTTAYTYSLFWDNRLFYQFSIATKKNTKYSKNHVISIEGFEKWKENEEIKNKRTLKIIVGVHGKGIEMLNYMVLAPMYYYKTIMIENMIHLVEFEMIKKPYKKLLAQISNEEFLI